MQRQHWFLLGGLVSTVCIVMIYAQTNAFFNDAWLPIDIDNPLAGLFFVGFKYGQATCVEPFYDLAKRICQDDYIDTPFEPFIGLCVSCLLVTDLTKCPMPCRANKYTCEFYASEIDLVGGYNFLKNVQEGDLYFNQER